MTAAPAVPLHRLYEFMRSMSGEERLEFSRWIAEKPHLFNEWSRRSVAFYARFPNVGEDFHPPRPELRPAESVREIRRGHDVAVLLGDLPRRRRWEVEEAPELAFRFVDHELAPLRKTSPGRSESDAPEMAGLRADLLLVGDDGVPIVGEVKCATAQGYDTDAILALVQGLTACAQLRAPQQMQRLKSTYPPAQFDASGDLDLFVLLVKPEQPARSTYQAELDTAAKRLAPILAAQSSVPVRRVAFIEARWDEQLELRLST